MRGLTGPSLQGEICWVEPGGGAGLRDAKFLYFWLLELMGITVIEAGCLLPLPSPLCWTVSNLSDGRIFFPSVKTFTPHGFYVPHCWEATSLPASSWGPYKLELPHASVPEAIPSISQEKKKRMWKKAQRRVQRFPRIRQRWEGRGSK